ncbi:uncharacterized protein N7496_008582 [Penicillium cataractarum]|uniref:Uncharacterized protein n=1 Tax=Penicillium cataractarum TaxID=2100454 RepID=A0A9W9RYW6_9EURO|nr:uncharacterized protein N7496_008582 [Penicillium cataractarum]KAJ5368822.1 hypothetical protein N7496_008582 [Penicillium cataractarum]
MTNHWWIPKSIDHPANASDGSYDPTSDGPPAELPAGQIMRYGARQRAGAELRRWIDLPNKPNCPITRNSITIQNLEHHYTIEIVQANPTDRDYANIFHHLELAATTENHTNSPYRNFDVMSMHFSWRGFVGPRVLIIEDMHRRAENVHHMSEVSLAFYETDCLIDTLQHVIVTNVVNDDTISFLSGEIHGDHLEFSEDWWRTWEYATPEYDALLATRIGKMVAYMVLGGFQRGTKWIPRINTVSSWDGISAHMHFKIADI